MTKQYKLTIKNVIFAVCLFLVFLFICFLIFLKMMHQEDVQNFPPCICTTDINGKKIWRCVYQGDYNKDFPGKKECK